MRLTVVDWNVNGLVRESQPEFLAGVEWDVALLQEMTGKSWRDFRSLGDEGGVSFDYLPALAGDGALQEIQD